MERANAKNVIYKFAALTIAFILNQSAYYGVEALQSSLNGAIGTYALSARYIASTTTSIFLPTLVLSFMKKNYAMGLLMLSYPVYTIANFYPRAYTLIPTSLLVGFGGPVVWCGSRVYISDLADEYAKIKGEDKEKITSLLFGLFYGFISMSLLAGNCLSSAIMRAFHDKSKISEFTSTKNNTSRLHCGIHNCIGNVSTDIYQDNDHTTVTKTAIYVLLAGFTVIQFAAAAILLCGMNDDISRSSDDSDERTSIIPEKKSNENQFTFRKVMKQVTATVRLHTFNLSAKFVIPFVVECGLLQGFALSQFTRDWVTCYMGIKYVGYVIGAYGLGSMIGSFGTGMVSKILPRWIITLFDLLVEVAVCTSLMVWEPNKIEDAWIHFLNAVLLGVVHASRKGIIATIYSLYFRSDKEAASSSFGVWDSLGKAIAFAISAKICNWTYVVLILSLTTIGTTLYFITEVIYQKTKMTK